MDETDKYRSLWAAVMGNAILDIQKNNKYKLFLAKRKKPITRIQAQKITELKNNSDSAKFWFKHDKNIGVGSYRWVCSVLGLDPQKTLDRIFNNIKNIVYTSD